MKTKLTNKLVKQLYPNIKCAGYCELQTLLRGIEPIAYTCGTYGWNYDIYNIYGVTIATGYRGMPGKHVEKGGEYEQKAQAIVYNYDNGMTHEQKTEKVTELLKEFCKINGGY